MGLVSNTSAIINEMGVASEIKGTLWISRHWSINVLILPYWGIHLSVRTILNQWSSNVNEVDEGGGVCLSTTIGALLTWVAILKIRDDSGQI